MIVIKKANISDAEGIRKLEESVWKDTNVAGRYVVGTLINFGYVFVAKSNGKIIGSILASRTKDNNIFVDDWVVDEKYRGRGIGRNLYAKFLEAVNGFELVTIIHPKDKHSLNFHLNKLNFTIYKKVKDPYGIGENISRVILRRKL